MGELRSDSDSPWVRFVQAPTPLARISAGVALVREVEGQIAADVRTLRSVGVSWAELGRALGVAGQSASRRFGARR